MRVTKLITSSANPVFSSYFDCLTSKGIKKHGLFLISGERVVRDTLNRFPDRCRELLIIDGTGPSELTRLAGSLPILALAPELFKELDIFGTNQPLLVANAPELSQADLSKPAQGLEVLCAMSEPSNVGALLRSAAAFGVSRVVLLRESASPFHPKAVRAASAATFATELVRGPSIQELQAPELIALDMNGEDLPSFRWPKNARLLIGEEGAGVPSELRAKRISIPMTSAVESLNAVVAASVALYSYRAQG